MKDIAVQDQFLDPFKWDEKTLEKNILGGALDLHKECLESIYFWNGLKKAHKNLKIKYPNCEETNHKLNEEIEKVYPILYSDSGS